MQRFDLIFFLPVWFVDPIPGHGLPYGASRSWTHNIRYDSSGGLISPAQRYLPDNTQQSQETNIHIAGGIRT